MAGPQLQERAINQTPDLPLPPSVSGTGTRMREGLAPKPAPSWFQKKHCPASVNLASPLRSWMSRLNRGAAHTSELRGKRSLPLPPISRTSHINPSRRWGAGRSCTFLDWVETGRPPRCRSCSFSAFAFNTHLPVAYVYTAYA